MDVFSLCLTSEHRWESCLPGLLCSVSHIPYNVTCVIVLKTLCCLSLTSSRCLLVCMSSRFCSLPVFFLLFVWLTYFHIDCCATTTNQPVDQTSFSHVVDCTLLLYFSVYTKNFRSVYQRARKLVYHSQISFCRWIVDYFCCFFLLFKFKSKLVFYTDW